MEQMERIEMLRWMYINTPSRRPRVFEQMAEIMDYKNHRVRKKYGRFLSDIELRGNFCLAVDEIMVDDESIFDNKDTFFLRFYRSFSKKTRECMEINCDIKDILKRKMVLMRHPLFKNMEKHDVKHLRIVFGLSDIKCERFENMYEQEIKLFTVEVKDYLIKRFGENTYNDFISHYVYGENFSDICYYDGDGIDRHTMSIRLKKVLMAVRKYFKENSSRLPQAIGGKE